MKRARGSVGELEARGEVQEVTAPVTSHMFQRLTQLEVRVTDAERTVRRQAGEILALRAEVAMLKGTPPVPTMSDEQDEAPLRPVLTRAEIDDLLEDTASELDEEAGPLEDQWSFKAADL